MEKLKDKIQRASAVEHFEMKENLSEAIERNDVSDLELHEMGTILLEEQEGEAKKNFAAIMSKFILKGEEVKYTDLNKEIEKQKPRGSCGDLKVRNTGAIPKRPKASGVGFRTNIGTDNNKKNKKKEWIY